jgi:hypothetical protein
MAQGTDKPAPRHEGGAQERALARQYREWAVVSGVHWPRMTRVLEAIARSWEEHARQEDVRAEQEKLGLKTSRSRIHEPAPVKVSHDADIRSEFLQPPVEEHIALLLSFLRCCTIAAQWLLLA